MKKVQHHNGSTEWKGARGYVFEEGVVLAHRELSNGFLDLIRCSKLLLLVGKLSISRKSKCIVKSNQNLLRKLEESNSYMPHTKPISLHRKLEASTHS